MAEAAIIARVLASPLEVDAKTWNALLARQSHPTPFMRHEYLAALHDSGSATPRTGWAPRSSLASPHSERWRSGSVSTG